MHRLHVVEAADEIDDRGAALDGAQSAGRIAYVGGDELRLAEAAERLQEGRGSRFALRAADARAARPQPLHDLTADEAAAAETGNLLRSEAHTSELKPLLSNSYAVFRLKKTNNTTHTQ